MHGDSLPEIYKGYELRQVFNVVYAYKVGRYVIARRTLKSVKEWIDLEEAGLPHEREKRR